MHIIDAYTLSCTNELCHLNHCGIKNRYSMAIY